MILKKQPFLLAVICFVSGILFQEYLSLSFYFSIFILVFSTILLSLLFFKNFFIQKFKAVFIGAFFFSVGVFLHFLNTQKPDFPRLNQKEEIVFKLKTKLNSNKNNRRYEVEIFNNEQRFNSVISIPKRHSELDYKHYYKGEVFLNPTKPPENSYQFDYAKYLKRRDIYFQSYLPGELKFHKRNDLSFIERMKQQRLDILQKIDKASISPKSREFMKGIILADRTEMDPETITAFQRSGVAHILAISGTHVGIIFGLFYLFFLAIIPSKLKRYAIFFSLLFIWAFGIFIGLGNSVFRACLMLTTFFMFHLLQRKSDLLHSLSLAALIILIINTNNVFDVGFQLSFSAVFGIFWLNQPILHYLPKQNTILKKVLFNTFSMTLACQIATLPLVLFYFSQFSFISIIANLVIIPLAQILIISSLIMTFFIHFKLVFNELFQLYDLLILKVLDLINWFSNQDFLFSKTIPMTLAEVLFAFIGIYFLRFLIKKMDLKNALRFSIAVLSFFILRLGLNTYHNLQDEILVHNHFNDRYFSNKMENHVIFWIPKSADLEKVQRFVIDPYLTSRRVKSFAINEIPEDAEEIKIGEETFEVSPSRY